MKLLDLPLLTDENIAADVAAALVDRGCDVRTVFDESLAGSDDATILEEAHQQGRVVVTHDSDFGDLAIRQGQRFFGIIYVRPGHIRTDVVIQCFDALHQRRVDVSSPFIAVVTFFDDHVQVRVRGSANPNAST